ncbi:MAG: hypothetical protein Tp156SUR915002_20 [Prokaryotic dsDNA virus sp.]|jgi:hypothetical protein|nr:MAG: hypothetical protein Tp162SUR384061_29 [Prokaryotic dsDNA virus sp.]QDP59759.1 MAG: hypothetical protein Tp156SUR915002_20 [Prokaryotic dsDNA virus sp.]|tara:strand:+ start:20053 stop:20427 length:375 start_codon:yes stop_codon:yes gene_type:complete
MNIEIMVSVAYKGAVDLASNGIIKANEIDQCTKKHLDILIGLVESKSDLDTGSKKQYSGGFTKGKPTENQLGLLKKLASEVGENLDLDKLTFDEASANIKRLLDNKKNPKQASEKQMEETGTPF